MFRRRLLALSCALAVGVAALAGCAARSQGVDVSGDWPVPEPTPSPSAGEDAPSLLVFGDSWTVGLASTTLHGGYAYLTGELLGWETTVAGENGSGYLRAGEHGGFYGSRVVQLDPGLDPDIIVVQGSINDRGQKLDGLTRAARSVWNALEAMYPEASLVILGPAPSTLPVSPAVERIDELLSDLAETEGVDYISPVTDAWVTDDNYASVIDTSPAGHNHPSDAGHAYLAELLVGELAPLAVNVGVRAGAGS